MEVNRNIYPRVEPYYQQAWFTNTLGSYPLNTELEDSITYSASTSNYAPIKNRAIISTFGSEDYYDRQFNTITVDNSAVQKIMLIKASENSSPNNWLTNYANNRKFGYNATSIRADNNRELVCDYNFFSVTYNIFIQYVSETGDIEVYTSSSNDFKSFDITNKKILNIGLIPTTDGLSLATNTIVSHTDFDIDESTGKFSNVSVIPFLYYNSGYAGMFEQYISVFGGGLSGTVTYGGKGSYICNGYNFARLEQLATDLPYYLLPVFNGTKEDIMHMCATFGVPFTTNASTGGSIDTICRNDDIYIPIIEENGLYQGDYASGEQEKRNTKQVQQRWDLPENWDAPWKRGVPDFDDIDTREFGDDNLTGFGGQTSALTHRYLLNKNQMKQVADYLNTTDKNVMSNIVNKLKMNGENPINSVVSVQYVPIDIDAYMEVTGADVVIGSNLINIGTIENPVKLTGTVVTTDTISIDLGSAKIKPINKNFLDYEPYTKYVAYIPYCNFVELDASIITGHELTFQLVCDLLAGTCEGVVRVDGQMYKTVGGNFMTQCSVQGIDNSSYVNGIISSTGKMVSGAGAIIGATALGVATGNVGMALLGIASGGATLTGGAYDFATTPKEYVATGKSIGLIGQYLPQHVCIYRYSCQDISDSNFGNFVGYACEFSAKLSSLSGLTVCHNPIINCTGNQQEIDEIKQLLENGVII